MNPMTEFEMQLLTVLDRLTRAVETIAMSNAKEPAFVKSLSDYRAFDWGTIGASVVEQDRDGVSVVEWGGYNWKRRNPSNNFDDAIFFTRPIGKKEDGSNKYARLITFKDMGKVKSINRDTEAVLEEKAATRPAEPAPQPAPKVDLCTVCGQPFPLHAPDCSTLKREPVAAQTVPPALAQPSELDAYLPRTVQPELPGAWPKTEAAYSEWLKARGWNGKETYQAVCGDAKAWLKKNPQLSWADVAMKVAERMGQEK